MSFFDIFLIIGFIVLVILRVPVCLCMLLTAFCYSLMSGALPISYVTQTMVSSVSYHACGSAVYGGWRADERHRSYGKAV